MRRLDESVQVRLQPPGESGGPTPSAPSQFIWRGRLYVVRSVVDHWRERRAWWRELVDGSRTRVEQGWGPGEHPGERRATLLAHRDPLAPEALEHEVWRVEASAGRLDSRGVYDLRRTDGAWQLVRLAD